MLVGMVRKQWVPRAEVRRRQAVRRHGGDIGPPGLGARRCPGLRHEPPQQRMVERGCGAVHGIDDHHRVSREGVGAVLEERQERLECLVARAIRRVPVVDRQCRMIRNDIPGDAAVDGDRLQLGELEFEVRHCPGHTPGHVVFHHAPARRAWVGDVLFAGSIGRTDFPRGDHQQLIDSIVTRLWPMGDDTVFIPGHGPESSFGVERRSNPYVGGT